jgi:hypothetical protein
MITHQKRFQGENVFTVFQKKNMPNANKMRGLWASPVAGMQLQRKTHLQPGAPEKLYLYSSLSISSRLGLRSACEVTSSHKVCLRVRMD